MLPLSVRFSAVRSPRAVDLLIAVAIAVAAVAQVVFLGSADFVPAAVVAIGASPLVVRRRFPVVVLVAVVLGAFAGSAVAGDDVTVLFLAVVFASYTVGRESSRRTARLVIAAELVLGVVGSLDSDEGIVTLLFIAGWLCGALGIGRLFRRRALRAAELRERTSMLDRLQREQAAASVANERARIARELHDVVAHCLTLIVVQSQALQRNLAAEYDRERADLESIRLSARETLAEMRLMLGVLRAPDGETVALAPQPGLRNLDDLLTRQRDGGREIDVRLEVAQPLNEGIDLVAYRVLEEALAQTSGATRIAVRSDGETISIDVAADSEVALPDLIGAGERVGLYGGVLTAERVDGGIAVSAVIPVPA